MANILHIIGPQGSGKSTLARWILRGLQQDGAIAEHWDADNTIGLSNTRIRHSLSPATTLALVESEMRSCRHADLQPGDWIVTIERAPA